MTFLPFSATALWRSFLLCAFVTSVLPPARAQRTQAAAPAEIRRLLPAPSRFDLDAGASQILPISASGMAVCEVSVSVRPHTEDETASLSYQWSVSQKPEGAKVTIAQSRAASAKVSFSKPGAYFLRVDVSAEGWSDWQSVAVQVFDPVQTGFAMDRFKRPPEAGIHPRVFFNPEEVPALRDKLKNTAFGREMAKKLQVNSQLMRLGAAGYDRKGPLSQLLDGSPMVSNPGYFASTSKTYQQLATGDLTALGASVGNMGGDIARLAKQMAAEALWCLLTEDRAGAEKAAAAITTWARIVSPTIKPGDDWQWSGDTFGLVQYGKQEMGRIFDKAGRDNIGLCYDFIYNYMTPEQRNVVRAMIAKATAGKIGYAMDQAHYARVGNWVTFHDSALMLLSLAIEGEPGYDPSVYRRGAEVFRDFYQYSVMEDGESFESLGKGGAYPIIVAAMARRGDWVAAHPHLREYYRRYLLNCLQPYGYHYVALSTLGDAELSGGMLLDAVTAKYCYPNDPDIELVSRNLLGENYGGQLNVDELLPLTLWGQDYKIPAGQPWEWDKSQPLTYVGRDQGLVITRNHWDRDALYLYFDCGSNIRDLGHYDPARNMFILSALGRNWIGDTGKEEMAEAHNVILIDGKGGSKHPGRLVNVTDTPDYTAMCGDAKPAYDWIWERGLHTHGEVDPTTVNQIRHAPLPERWMETPLTYLYSFFSPFRLARKPYNPVQFAYRTALLRRGANPYVVIADTIQKDNQPHHYEFLARLPVDLEKQYTVNGNDIILADPKTSRRLLVRFITPGQIAVTERTLSLRADVEKMRPILSVAASGVHPDFRVLFYPFQEGSALPATMWDDAGGNLSISVAKRRDIIHFAADKKGQPSVELGGNPIEAAPRALD